MFWNIIQSRNFLSCNDTEHVQTLQRVLKVIVDKGRKVNKDKCQFMLEEINFLGYKQNKQDKKKQRQSKTHPVLRILSNRKHFWV